MSEYVHAQAQKKLSKYGLPKPASFCGTSQATHKASQTFLGLMIAFIWRPRRMIQQFESGMLNRSVSSPAPQCTSLKLAKKGLTHKILKGHSKWVFCLNYNTASNLLVSGGCDGDVRIWNTARGTDARGRRTGVFLRPLYQIL